MPTPSLQYRTCIVRAWFEKAGGSDDERTWRLTIETPSTGERRGFSNREDFMEALLQHLFANDTGDNSAGS